MQKFIVFAKRTETLCAVIEADSAEKAERLADENYPDYDWSDCDESLDAQILFGETEEEEYE